MARRKETGMFAEVKVSRPNQAENAAGNENDPSGNVWRFIKITYPNGVTITVPSGLDPESLSRYIYSFIATCAINNVNLLYWLEYVMDNLHSTPEDRLHTLLPQHWVDPSKIWKVSYYLSVRKFK